MGASSSRVCVGGDAGGKLRVPTDPGEAEGNEGRDPRGVFLESLTQSGSLPFKNHSHGMGKVGRYHSTSFGPASLLEEGHLSATALREDSSGVSPGRETP